MEKIVPLGLPRLSGKCRSILQRSVPVGPTGRTLKMESTNENVPCISSRFSDIFAQAWAQIKISSEFFA